MKHITQAITVIACFAMLLGILLYIWQSHQVPESVKALQEQQQLEWMAARHRAAVVSLWVLVFSSSTMAIAGILLLIVKIRNTAQRVYAREGLFPIILENTGNLLDGLTGATQKTSHNPNLLAAAAGTIRVERGGATTLSIGQNGFSHPELIGMHNGQQRIQLAQTKKSIAGPNKWEVLERNNLLPKPKADDAIEGEVKQIAPVAMLPLKDAIAQSSADRFVLGQADDGALCTINPRAVVHFGILGSTGCGKTASTGFHLAMAAMRSGYRVIILDGKGGMDWSVFADVAEVHDTDRSTFLDQMEVISREYVRRMELARRYQVKHVAMLQRADVPPLLVIIEEFGDLARSLGPKRMGQIDAMLDTLGAMGRAADLHCCLIDQSSKHWSDVVMGATKAKVIYKVAGSDAARCADWHAQTLPDQGRFRYNGHEYNAWHVEPDAPKLLTTGKRAGVFSTFPALIDAKPQPQDPLSARPSVRTKGEGTAENTPSPPPSPPPDTPTDSPTDAQQRILAYDAANPGASVRQAAKALGLSKSYVSDVRRATQSPTDAFGRPQLIIDAADPSQAEALTAIRQAIESGQATVKGRKS